MASTRNQSASRATAERVEDGGEAEGEASRMTELEEYFRYKKERDNASDVRTALLTVAVLMATATFQSGLSPPGGVWQETNNNTNPIQTAGASVMGTNNHFAFGLFMFGNTLGFYFSLYIIDFLTRGFPLRLELVVAMMGMVVTYCSSMITIAPTRFLGRAFAVLSVLVPIAIPFIVRFLRERKLCSCC